VYNRNLIEYLPEAFRDVKENEAILTMAEQPEMVSSWGAIDNALNDQFIFDATENGVSRFEKIMKIAPKADESLDSRKFTILVKNNEQIPFTFTALKKQLELLCGEDGYKLTRDVTTKVLSVKVALDAKNNFNDVADLLERTVPANMVIDISLMYHQHFEYTLSTHNFLQRYTHSQLKDD
jgi:hypothetical protein